MIKHIVVILVLLTNVGGLLPLAQAQYLPPPSTRISLSPSFNPPVLKGIKVYPDNPLRFDFILEQADKGNFREESDRLIKYFLASLTVPQKDLWVNLSPYEKNKIIPKDFGLTEMGRDLLAEDYVLKQITASLIYPEDQIGKEFWQRIYREASEKFGTTDIPLNTFNKVWIVPEKAVVYENGKVGAAYVVQSHLKVMLEEDYLALQKNSKRQEVSALGSQIVREIVLPRLTKEVNENKNFARLRQIYHSLILASWYKRKIKDSLLVQVYTNKNKTPGLEYKKTDSVNIQSIYQHYLKAFKKGVFNYIKEEIDPVTQEMVPRKYFSGGFFGSRIDKAMTITNIPPQNKISHAQVVQAEINAVKDKAMIGDVIERRLKGAHEFNQIAVLDWDSVEELRLICSYLIDKKVSYIEITEENFPFVLEHVHTFGNTLTFVAPGNLKLNSKQMRQFLKIINFSEIDEDGFQTIQGIARGQAEYFLYPGKDFLTGLNNRRGFEAAFKRFINAGIRGYGRVHVDMVVIDVDHFKAINDLFGHSEGDQVLKRFSQSLLKETRSDADIVARWGGEEFILLMPIRSHESHVGPRRVHMAMSGVEYTDILGDKMTILRKLEEVLPTMPGPAIYEAVLFQLSLQNNMPVEKLKEEIKDLQAAVNAIKGELKKQDGADYVFNKWLVTSSMGAVEYSQTVRTFPQDADTQWYERLLEQMFKKADGRLLVAKRNGRNRIEYTRFRENKDLAMSAKPLITVDIKDKAYTITTHLLRKVELREGGDVVLQGRPGIVLFGKNMMSPVPDAFVSGELNHEPGRQELYGIYLKEELRGQGLMRFLLALYFRRFENSRILSSHSSSVVLRAYLIETFGFGPLDQKSRPLIWFRYKTKQEERVSGKKYEIYYETPSNAEEEKTIREFRRLFLGANDYIDYEVVTSKSDLFMPVYLGSLVVTKPPKFKQAMGSVRFNDVSVQPAGIDQDETEDEEVGGIDLSKTNIQTQIGNQGSFQFRLDSSMMSQLQQSPGFTPVIISIKPLTDLHSFLGIVNLMQ